MITTQELMQLQTHFSSDKTFYTDGYYQIKPITATETSLSFFVGGPCGEMIPHPTIQLEKTNEHWVPVKLRDLEVTPIQMITRSTETAEQLDQALTQLIEKFKTAKK